VIIEIVETLTVPDGMDYKILINNTEIRVIHFQEIPENLQAECERIVAMQNEQAAMQPVSDMEGVIL